MLKHRHSGHALAGVRGGAELRWALSFILILNLCCLACCSRSGIGFAADVLGLDDKAMVPLGMPGLPVDTGARGPKGPVLAPIGQQLGALGSDSHRQGALVPSLTFV